MDFSKQCMLVYDYNGKYVRGFRNDTYFDRFWVLNDSLAVCSNNDITIEDRAFTLSLKDGKKKDVLLGKKKIDTGTGTATLMVNIGAFSRVCKYQNDIFLCIATTDTVYAYNTIDKKLRPVYIQSPLNKEDDLVKTVPYLQFESSKYASVLINKPPMPDYTYWFNKEDGTLSKVQLKNKELGHAILGWGTNKKNVIIDILEMPKLKEYEESHTLSGKLQTLVATSKEDDNPIIMIAIIND